MNIDTKGAYLLFDIDSKFIMPDEYKGDFLKNGGYTKNTPRKWTEHEIEWVSMLIDKGLNTKQIARCIDRDSTQVSIKIKRIWKNKKTYNKKHIIDKYTTNKEFISMLNIGSVLDLYSGEKSYYSSIDSLIITSNDKQFPETNTYGIDSLKCICNLYYQNQKYDLVDLDPFGSAYDCFDLAIKMAKKGLVITLGELGHKRFKRLDFVKRYYGIESIEDFNVENIVNHIIKIGERNKKKLIPVFIKNWRNISRVYFKIEELKITEQWL